MAGLTLPAGIKVSPYFFMNNLFPAFFSGNDRYWKADESERGVLCKALNLNVPESNFLY
jgi:hypothetical protein